MSDASQVLTTDQSKTSRGWQLSIGDLMLVVAISAVYCLIFPFFFLFAYTYYAFPIWHFVLVCKDRPVEGRTRPIRDLLDLSVILVVLRWLTVLFAGAPAPLGFLIWTDCGHQYRLLAICELLPVVLMGVYTLVFAIEAKHRWGLR